MAFILKGLKIMDEKYIKKARKIVDIGTENLLSMVGMYDNSMDHKTTLLKFTLCFYLEFNIKFVECENQSMFGTVDIWFNGDIEIGISRGFTDNDVDWNGLIDLISVGLFRRDELKKLDKYFTVPYNMSIKTFLIDNFSEHIITAIEEIEENGFSKTADMFKNFFEDGNKIRQTFFKEVNCDYT